MKLTQTNIENLIKNCKTRKDIIKKLEAHHISFKDESDLCEYTNIKIPTGGERKETIRIYRPHKSKTYAVQMLYLTTFEYSGIPTFFGGGLFNKVKG